MKTSFRRTAPLLLVGIGLLLTFCGSATAAHLITGKQIKDSSITSVDLRDAGVGGADVQDRSVAAADLDRLVTPGGTGAPGERGAPGGRGPSGPSGTAGIAGFRGVTVVKGPKEFVENEKGHRKTVYCPENMRVLSGGVLIDSDYVQTRESAPLDGGIGWTVNFYMANNYWGYATPYAVCASA
jgi:hypothetical protein